MEHSENGTLPWWDFDYYYEDLETFTSKKSRESHSYTKQENVRKGYFLWY